MHSRTSRYLDERRGRKERRGDEARLKKKIASRRDMEKKKDGRSARVEESERERKTSTQAYLNEATSGRRLRATHGGNPYTRARTLRGVTHTQAATRERESARNAIARARMAAIGSTRGKKRDAR